MEYYDLFSKYLLIIGYAVGNVLAYNSVENPNYKWPMVYGYNAIILLVWLYTYWARLGGKQQAEKTYQEQISKLREEFKVNTEEWERIHAKSTPPAPNTYFGQVQAAVQASGYNVYSSQSTEIKTQELANLQAFVSQREAAEKKEKDMERQAEVLRQAEALENQLKGNLEQVAESLKEPPISWQLIREKYPEFESRSSLLTELAKSDKLMAEEFDPRELKELTEWLEDLETSSQDPNPKKRKRFTEEQAEVLAKLRTIKPQVSPLNLTRLAPLTEKEMDLLDNLELTLEQYIAISLQTPYLSKEEKEFITDHYLHLSKKTHLELLKAGFRALGIDTYDKLLKLYRLIEACQTEKENFGLSIKEKEGILKFLSSKLNLSEEQKQKLEEMGLKLYNASEWTITEEQKDHLLDTGLSSLKLTEEQKGNLTELHPDQFKTFSLTESQKNTLQSLSPLIREDKYSSETLELLRSSQFKSSSVIFLVQEEILPDPNTQFGTAKSSYLPLKTEFLKGEQKTLLAEKTIQEKEFKETEIQENKLSILRSLMILAEKCLANYQSLKDVNFSLTDWVQEKVLTSWQTDILLTCGFKTIPKYNFFELLIYAVEKFAGQDWTDFLAANSDLQEEFNLYLAELRNNPPITINETIWEKFASSQSQGQREIIQQLNLKELVQEQLNSLLGNREFIPENKGWVKWKDLNPDFNPYLVQEWKDHSFSYETTKEWLNIGLEINDSSLAAYLRDQLNLTPEEVLNNGNQEELREQFREYQSTKPARPASPKSTNKYDELLVGLNEQERERQHKKLEREESRKKLEAEELRRREEKLSEKDKKLKEDEERRQKERELAELEAQKKEEARLAREQALREEQETYLNNQVKSLEDRKKAREENLIHQQKEMEVAESKKREQIAKLEQENKLAAEKLQKDKELLEKETQERLAQIAAEDETARQAIHKQAEQRRLDLEARRKEDERMLEEKKQREMDNLAKLQAENETKLAEAQAAHEVAMEKERAETETLQKEKEQVAQQTREAVAEHLKKQKADMEAEQERKKQAAFEESKAKSERMKVVSFNQDKKNAISAIRYYVPTRTDISQGFQDSNNNSVTFQTQSSGFLFQVHEWISNYSGAKLNINQWSSAGVADESRQRLGGGTSMPDEDDQRVRRIGNWLGNAWLTWEEVERRINEAPIEEKGRF